MANYPHFNSHISSAVKIIESYKGSQPLGQYLKLFFSANKKYGSKDRKTIAALCYYYYRTGQALKTLSTEEKILAGLFLCNDVHNDTLDFIRPEWNKKITLSKKEKLEFLNINPKEIFPWTNELSSEIDTESFFFCFLKQPNLFLRIRPGKEETVIKKLQQSSIEYKIEYDCITLANSAKVESFFEINKEVVIQDYNSQKVLDYLEINPSYFKDLQTICAWDCCAASGGKSILLNDLLNKKIQLTVSDIRSSILENLKKRLKDSSVKIEKSLVLDITKENLSAFKNSFDIIICDAPCSGSGTWARTPEQLSYFDHKKINFYCELQKKIVTAALPALKKNGLFFYITCSVFKKENEEVVSFIQKTKQLKLLQLKFLKGYETGADSMFVAVFTKN